MGSGGRDGAAYEDVAGGVGAGGNAYGAYTPSAPHPGEDAFFAPGHDHAAPDGGGHAMPFDAASSTQFSGDATRQHQHQHQHQHHQQQQPRFGDDTAQFNGDATQFGCGAGEFEGGVPPPPPFPIDWAGFERACGAELGVGYDGYREYDDGWKEYEGGGEYAGFETGGFIFSFGL